MDDSLREAASCHVMSRFLPCLTRASRLVGSLFKTGITLTKTASGNVAVCAAVTVASGACHPARWCIHGCLFKGMHHCVDPVHHFRLYRSAKICKYKQFAANAAAVVSIMQTAPCGLGGSRESCRLNARHANCNAAVVKFLKRNGDFLPEEHMFLLAHINLILYPVNSGLKIANLSAESNFATLWFYFLFSSSCFFALIFLNLRKANQSRDERFGIPRSAPDLPWRAELSGGVRALQAGRWHWLAQDRRCPPPLSEPPCQDASGHGGQNTCQRRGRRPPAEGQLCVAFTQNDIKVSQFNCGAFSDWASFNGDRSFLPFSRRQAGDW